MCVCVGGVGRGRRGGGGGGGGGENANGVRQAEITQEKICLKYRLPEIRFEVF